MRFHSLLLPLLCAACSSSRPNQVVFVEARPEAPAIASGPADTGQVYFEFQVERPVAPLGTVRGPGYPEDLRAARVEGEVLAQFVVSRQGVPLMSTFTILKSSHIKFSDSVRDFVSQARFKPAELRGQPVPQLVQQPFNFALTR